MSMLSTSDTTLATSATATTITKATGKVLPGLRRKRPTVRHGHRRRGGGGRRRARAARRPDPGRPHEHQLSGWLIRGLYRGPHGRRFQDRQSERDEVLRLRLLVLYGGWREQW